MKTLLRLALGVIMCSAFSICNAQSVTSQTGQTVIPPSTPYAITMQDGNSRVWERTDYETDPSGQLVPRNHQYSELASGLNHQVNGQWVESKESIDILPNGTAAATNGQHQAYFPGDIYQGQIELVMSDGIHLKSRPLALSYFDGTNTEIIAELTNSIGLVGDNQVTYPNAFTGFKVDLRFTYSKAGFEQDIILRQQPPTPESFGLNPHTARLQILTEFFAPPQPAITSTVLAPQAGLSLTDQNLDFGAMHMVPGRAFLMGTNAVAAKARVSKHWLLVNGRQFLLEEVPVNSILDGLAALPLTAMNSDSSKHAHMASKELKLPPQRLAQTSSKTMLLAKTELPAKGLVMDYQTAVGNLTNYTFQADTTYYISGNVFLYGATTIEGNTVVKYINPGPTLQITGSVNCKTGPYRPALFTSVNDNSAGEAIGTGFPAIDHSANCYYLFFYNISQVNLHDLRMCYSYCPITVDTGSLNLSDAQFIHNDYPMYFVNVPQANVFNALMEDVEVVAFEGFSAAVNVKHLTLDQCVQLGENDYSSTLAITNSLIVGTASMGDIPYTTNYVARLSTNSNVFQTVAGGQYYLAPTSIYRNVGTTNIESSVLADIRNKTTYPPTSFTNASVSVATTFSPQAQRDTDAPDLGYHYDPLDYVFGGSFAYSNMTFTAGTAVGWFRTTSGWSAAGYGIDMKAGVTVSFAGTATAPTYWVRLNTVQEQDYTAGYGQAGIETWVTSNLPWVTGQFLRCSVLAGELRSYFSDDGGTVQAAMLNSEFWGGSLCGYGDYRYFTNCLLQRVNFTLWNGNTISSLALRDCTVIGGTFQIQRNSSGITPVTVRNSAFDGTIIDLSSDYYAANATNTDYDYNAYTNTSDPFSLGGTHDVPVATTFNWQTNWLGNYYQATNSLMINMGSTNANLLGLYHFTTQTNQVKEANSIVDIGYHYVATDAFGIPLDNNSDGIPDYLEDANGNGLLDPGEIGWNIMGDLNLQVLITRPINGIGLP